jgi:hypothetical protein
MIKEKLSSGREIIIKELSIDDIDECKDALEIIFADKGRIVKGASKARTKWIRAGLQGGDFKSKDGKGKYEGSKNKTIPDYVIKQLTDGEVDECSIMIQKAQKMGND